MIRNKKYVKHVRKRTTRGLTFLTFTTILFLLIKRNSYYTIEIKILQWIVRKMTENVIDYLSIYNIGNNR